MAKLFDDILKRGIAEGQIPARTKLAREWYRNQAKAAGRINETAFFKSATHEDYQTRFKLGHMYMFYYDPKHKDTLPYYDRVPLIFPIAKAKGGFLGINFHYLPLNVRAKLMDALYDVTNNKKYDETTKLKVTYSILESAAKFRMFKPAVKHYLTSHVKTRLMYIKPTEWDIALWLGIAKFKGATQAEVWADSKKIIRGK